MEYGILAKNLKFHRKNQGLTQNKLGQLTGLGQVTIANYESSKRFPNEKGLSILAESLKIPVHLLFLDKPVNRTMSKERIYTIRRFIELLKTDKVDECYLYINSWKESLNYNIVEAYEYLIIPTLKEIGDQWSNGTLLISEEHIISEKIREIIVLISYNEVNEKDIQKKNGLVWMGFCAPAEEHDLVLLMLSHIARTRGWKVYFIGKNTPILDIIQMIKKYKPSGTYISILMESYQAGLDAFLNIIDREIKLKSPIYICGLGANADYINRFDSITGYIPSLLEAYESLISLEEKL